MAVGYRSIFSLRHGQDAVRLTAEQFRSWLALKGYGLVVVAPGVHEVAEHTQLVVTELDPHDGSRSLRYRLTESSSAGEWVTAVTVHRDGTEDDWIWVDVNAPPSAPRPTASPERFVKEVDAADAWWTGVPHMVREILSVADAYDGEMILAARPTLVTVGDVDGLISAICDPGRRGTALVAAPIPDVPVPRLIGHPGRSRPPSCEPSRQRHQALSPAGQLTGPLARLTQGRQRPRRSARSPSPASCSPAW